MATSLHRKLACFCKKCGLYCAILTYCFLITGRCGYDLDSYKTVFHPVGHGVSYPNYRQRLEVKTFAFVSGDKSLPGLVSDTTSA